MEEIQVKRINYANALVDSILNGSDDDEIKSIIHYWNPSEETSSSEYTPLTAAILERKYGLLDELLDKMNPEAINQSTYGSTALLLVASDESQEASEAVTTLLNRGACVNAKDTMGWPVITKLALHSDQEAISAALNAGADVNTASDRLHLIPLMAAAARDDRDLGIIWFLLARGADVEARTAENQTAFDFASEAGNLGAMALLRVASLRSEWQRRLAAIQAGFQFAPGVLGGGGAETHTVEEVKKCAETHAVEHEDISDMTPLMNAAAQANHSYLERRLENANDQYIQERDAKGRNVLNYAIIARNAEIMRLILDRNSTLANTADNQGLCQLTYSIVNFPKGLRMLLEKGADPNVQDASGLTPFSYLYAVQDEQERGEVEKLLIEYGAKPETRIGD